MAGDDDIVDHLVVKVSPDTDGFGEKLEKDTKKESKGVKAKVKAVADGSGLKESVAAAVKEQMARPRQPVYKVKVAADGAGLKELVAKEVAKQQKRANQPVYKVKVVADEKGLQKAVIAGASTREKIENREAERAAERAERNAERTAEREVRAAERAVREKTRAAERAAREQTRIAERAAREQERVQRESQARISKFFTKDRPQFIDYGGKGIRPMNLLYGVVTALSPALAAMGASALQASTSIAALGSAGIGAALGLSGVLVAFQGIGDLLSLRKQVLNEQTAGAANAAREAVRNADDLAKAKRDLADAQRGEAEAERDLHDARRQAVRDLEDLKQSVISLNNQYKSDTLSVAEARQRAQATDRNFFATALERARAWQDVRDAETQQKETALERRQKQQDLKKSLAGGIEQSDRVRDARERVRDARDRTLDAQAALRKSSGGTATSIDKVSSASAQLAQKLKELGPAARDMYEWFVASEDLFKRLRRELNNAVLPGFTTFLKALTAPPKGGGKSTLEIAAQYAGELGGIIGKYAGKFGKWMQEPLFRESMARIQKINKKAFDNLGQSLLNLADPITRILDAAAPGFESLSEVILDLTERFNTWIETLDKSGGLDKWFADARVELEKWWEILKNVGEIFKNVFTAALPSGSGLVTSFRDFTEVVADWTSSPEGKKWLTEFFQTFRDLPYAQIIDFLKNAVIMFAAFRTLKLAYTHPLIAALTAFAAANPQGTASAFKTIADAIGWVVEKAAANPEALAGIVALLAAAKVGKAVGFDIKIPAVTALRDALTSKFKVLDKFIGGGATTATMTVHAGVVNIYGKAGGGGDIDLPGKKKPPVVLPGAKPGRTPKIPGGLRTAGGAAAGITIAAQGVDLILGGGQGFAGLKALLSGPDAYAKWSKENEDEFTRFFSHTLPETLVGGNNGWSSFGDALESDVGRIERFFSHTLPESLVGGDNGWSSFVDAFWNDLGVGSDARNGTVENFALPQMALEKNAFNRLTRDLFLNGGFDNASTQSSLNAWVEQRKKSVDSYVRYVRSQQGPIAAARVEKEEHEKSKKALVELYQQYGVTTPEAKKFADQAFGVATESSKATTEVQGLNDKLGTLSERIDAVTGKKQIVLTLDGEEKVFASLETAAAYQDAIRQGVPPTQAKLRQIKEKWEKTKGLAAGGSVDGYSPHDKADNIPAWLTADEFVQPVAAVKYYGTDFMEAVRTRRFPRFAAGGQVEQWPFKVKMPDALKPVLPYTDIYNQGIGPVPGLGSGATPGTWPGLWAAVKGNYPQASLYSAYRRGSKTLSGKLSRHALGKAIDVTPIRALAEWIYRTHGGSTFELISPWTELNLYRGRPHKYSRAIEIQHGAHGDPTRNAHIHWSSYADGGIVQARRYDRGGILPPGFTTVFNGTGRNETVRTQRQEQHLAQGMRLDPRDINLLANAVTRTAAPAVTMDGRRVAEVTNRYNYLPSGV